MKPLDAWITELLRDPDMVKMGHHQRTADRNLGLGWLYYGLARVHRPSVAVVIGSYRGFVPLVLARALADNGEGGEVVFVDPGLVDDFWHDAERVARHFAAFGVGNIRHVRATTEEFTLSEGFGSLHDVGMLFVDGYHSAEQARFDFTSFSGVLTNDAIVMFHDSVRSRRSRIYGEERAYEHTVVEYMRELESRPDLQMLDLPFDSGVTLVRRRYPERGDWTA